MFFEVFFSYKWSFHMKQSGKHQAHFILLEFINTDYLNIDNLKYIKKKILIL